MPPPAVRRWVAVAWPVVALAVVCGLEALLSAGPWPVVVVGLLDEPAHLLTAALVVAALPSSRLGTWVPWALIGSVAVDVDHVPLYLWEEPVALPGSRPVTHSLATVAALLLATAVVSRRVRPVPLGLAVGVALHLARDVAGAPGVPLFWPLQPEDVELPLVSYLAGLAVVTVLAVVRGRTLAISGAGGR